MHIGGQEPVYVPVLPPAIAEEVNTDEKAVHEALHHLDDVEALRNALPLAQRALSDRAAHQGVTWWETIDARQRLAMLRLVLSLSPEQRSSLAQAERTGSEAAELEKERKYSEAAEKVLTMAIAERQILGEDHTWYASSLAHLADIYHYHLQQHHGQAEALYQRALAIMEKALGPDHPDLADPLSTLAGLYYSQHQYTQAEPLYKRALAIQESIAGSENPIVALTLESLAEIYKANLQFAQAEPLYKRALTISEKALGPEHPAVAMSLNDLGQLYQFEGQYAQAESLYKRALAIREKALGSADPDVAESLTSLGNLYSAEGQFAEAESSFKSALGIFEHSFGLEDRAVYDLNELATLYRVEGKRAEAEQLLKRALAMSEKAFGPEHGVLNDLAIASVLNDLALLYQDEGQYAQAEPLYKRALEIQEKALGPEQIRVAVTLNNLAELYYDEGQFGQVEPMIRRALVITEKVLGSRHPVYATELANLAAILMATDRKSEAAGLLLSSAQVRWLNLTENFPTLSDQQKQQFLAQSSDPSAVLSSMVFQAKGSGADAGFRGILLNKQLPFEAARQESGALRVAIASAPPEWQEAWRERERLRHQYSTLVL
jgi:tetratricopeptide (TPR) repeat protein